MTTINKALVAGAAALVQLQLALADSSLGASAITGHEWAGIGVAAFAAVGVYAVPYATGRVRSTGPQVEPVHGAGAR
jgi:hypothetical protein